MRPTTAIAVSGGIDSLVTAALLKDQGHHLIGLHFITGYESKGTLVPNEMRTDAEQMQDPSSATINRLKAMINQIGVPIHIIDLKQEFQSRVVDYFTHTYQSGRTPNPCLVCNPQIKFEILYNKGKALGAQTIATGHYARIQAGPDGRMHLLRGVDTFKDQSYFLARLSQTQLSRIILPLGETTKEQTRRIAQQKGLSPAAPGESQDICFIQNGKYGEFIEQQPGFISRPGPIEDLSGQTVGRHNGLHLFTIGQRRGINCPAKAPYYVHHLDVPRNCLVVCFKKDLYRPACKVSNINWIGPVPEKPLPLKVRLRYRHEAADATLTPLDNLCADIHFKTPQEAVSPGQGAVFYQDDEVLGAGWIE